MPTKREQRKLERSKARKAKSNRKISVKNPVDSKGPKLRPRNFQEVLYNWTPATLNPKVKTEDFEIFETKEHLINVAPHAKGSINGALEIIGFTKDPNAPYAVRCGCGRVLKMNVDEFINNSSCGCFPKAVRTAYLIRMRIEVVRSWMNNIQSWLQDLDVIEEYMLDFIEKARNINEQRSAYVRRAVKEGEVHLTHGNLEAMPQELLDFFMVVAMSPGYKDFLDRMTELNKAYNLWEAIPLKDINQLEGWGNSMPEFDMYTFINFMNFLEK